MLSIAFLVLSALSSSTLAADTVLSQSGLTYDCPSDPSVVPAFTDDICATTLHAVNGDSWPFAGQSLNVNYPNSPSSYYSVDSGDIYLVCNWQDPNSIRNSYGCRYDAGAGTGRGWGTGILWNAAGTGFNQQCPPLQRATKPQPSPGLEYKRDTTDSGSNFACATVQDGGRNYLYGLNANFDATGDMSYFCFYQTANNAITCQYDSTGALVNTNDDCPLQQCTNVPPSTRRKRSLAHTNPLAWLVDAKRQTSREAIVERMAKRQKQESQEKAD